MRANAFARMQPVSKESKEARLREFIQKDIIARRNAQGDCAGERYRLIARSPDSPIAQALASLGPDVVALGIEIEAVFLRFDPPRRGDNGTEPLDTPQAACRVLSDPRLTDVHEQLVLGKKTAWIGDSMRRDPSRRDSFECYCEGCDRTAGWAASSFERIWAAGAPVDLDRAVNTIGVGSPRDQIDLPLIIVTEEPAVALRH